MLLSLICIILLLGVCGKIFAFSLKAAWSITKVIFSVAFLPIIVIGLLICGLVYIALPLVIIVGIIALVMSAANNN